MKKQDIKNILWILCLICLVCCTIFAYIHRRVIKAALKGEELPPLPAGHPHHFFLKQS